MHSPRPRDEDSDGNSASESRDSSGGVTKSRESAETNYNSLFYLRTVALVPRRSLLSAVICWPEGLQRVQSQVSKMNIVAKKQTSHLVRDVVIVAQGQYNTRDPVYSPFDESQIIAQRKKNQRDLCTGYACKESKNVMPALS